MWENSVEELALAFQGRDGCTLNGCGIVSAVYPVVYLKDFLPDDRYTQLEAGLRSISYEKKHSDLFRFSQTGDLNKTSATAALRTKIVANLLPAVERIVGRPLSRTLVDLSSQLYSRNEYLLPHDDRLDSRRVAFVLYLVDGAGDFAEADGGALEFFPTDWRGEPTHAVGTQKFYPQANTLIFFEVSRSSHHQVQQVLSGRSRRSVAGWLHDPSSDEVERIPKRARLETNREGDEEKKELSSLSSPLPSILMPDLVGKLAEYACKVKSAGQVVHAPFGTFKFLQTMEEASWMKAMLSRSFIDMISQKTHLCLDYPTRPVMRIFLEADETDHQEAGPKEADTLYLTIHVEKDQLSVDQSGRLPKDRPCTLVTMQFKIIR